MFKKIVSIFCAALMCASVLVITAPETNAASVTVPQIVSAAAGIIRQNEGSYSSVNCDDNGSLSVGWLQWHGDRALSLLRTIVNANPAQAQSILGSGLYSEILNASSWSTRILTSSEASVISKLLSTSEGMAAQDELASNNITNYVNHGMALGITVPTALIYFADLENQCGGGGSARVAASAAGLTGGSYGGINLENIHKAAMLDAIAGKYSSRRNKTYNYCILLGWESSALSYSYELWTTTCYLNVRAKAGTSGTLLTGVSANSGVVITKKVTADGGTWGKCYMGWLSLDYCDYNAGSIKTPVQYNIGTGHMTETAISSFPVTALNSTRPANSIVIFDSMYGANAATNQWGGEAAVDVNGLVTYFGGYGSCNTAIPRDGFVISGIGAGYEWLSTNVRAGCYLYFDECDMVVSAYATPEGFNSDHKFAFYGQPYGYLPTPVSDGCLFDGWYDSYTQDAKYVDASTSNWARRTMTLYGRFREAASTSVVYVTDGGTLDGTFQYPITGVNKYRGTNQLIIYDSGNSTGTNIYGAEAVVGSDGVVSAINKYGTGDSPIPEGGFVLSGNGTMCEWIYANIFVGNYITYDSTALTITVYSSAEVFSSINKMLKEGSPIGKLPSVSKEHYIFDGWFTAAGAPVSESTVVGAQGLVVYAHWTLPAGKVSFDTAGGTLSGAVSTYPVSGTNVPRTEGSLVVYQGVTSTGTNSYGYEAVVDVTGTVVCVYPYGQGNSPIPPDGFIVSGNGAAAAWIVNNLKIGRYVTVSGGKVNVYLSGGNSIYTNLSVLYGSTYGALPIPEREGCEFLGWYDSNANHVYAGKTVDLYGDVTLTAHWLKTAKVRFDPAGGEVTGATAAARANGMNIVRETDYVVIYRGIASTGTNSDGAEAIIGADGIVSEITTAGNSAIPSGGFVISGNGQMAQWILNYFHVGNYVSLADFYITVYYHGAQYQALNNSFVIRDGLPVGTLPDAWMSGVEFVGWQDADGNMVGTDAVFDVNCPPTLTAIWNYPSGKVSFDTDGGTLSASLASMPLTGVNSARGDNGLVYYSGTKTTGTDARGCEAAVAANGKILCVYPFGKGNNVIPEGGYVISGSGSMSKWVLSLIPGSQIRITDLVVYEYSSAGNMVADMGKTVTRGDTFGLLPDAVKEGYVFCGWYLGDTEITPETVVADCNFLTLTARYVKASKISFDCGDVGRLDGYRTYISASSVNTLLLPDQIVIYEGIDEASVSRDAISAVVATDGSVTALVTGTDKVSVPFAGKVISARGTMAEWIKANISVGSCVLVRDSNVFVFASKVALTTHLYGFSAAEGAAVGTLPAATSEILKFDGWYLDPGCTQRFTEASVVPSGDFTLYAGWQK